MCLAIYTTKKGQKAAIRLGLESVLLRRSGQVEISIRFAIQNTGKVPISRLRVIIPHAIVDDDDLKNDLQNRIAKLEPARRLAELKKIQQNGLSAVCLNCEALGDVVTNDLESFGFSNVHVVPQSIGNRWAVSRGENAPQVEGTIHTQWSVAPPQIEHLHWHLFTLCKLCFFDLVAHNNAGHIHAGETAWFRLDITICPSGDNKPSLWQKLIDPSITFKQTFRSSSATDAFLRAKVSTYAHLVMSQQLPQSMKIASGNLVAVLPKPDARCIEEDWRVALIREFGLRKENIRNESGVPEPRVDSRKGRISVSAFPKRARVGWWPGFLNFIFARRDVRTDIDELWFSNPPTGGDQKGCTSHVEVKLGRKVDLLLRILIPILLIVAQLLGIFNKLLAVLLRR